MEIILIVKVLLAILISSSLGYLSLLSSRDALCVDVEESTGRHLYKNKKKKGKQYPNRLKWFFLWNYLPHIRKWHYICFILDILFTFSEIIMIVIIVIMPDYQILWDTGLILFLILAINKLMITLFPWGRYRP